MFVRLFACAGLWLPFCVLLGCGGSSDSSPAGTGSSSATLEAAPPLAPHRVSQPHTSAARPSPESTAEPFDVQALLARRAVPPESENAALLYRELLETNLYKFLADRDLHDQSREGEIGLKFQEAARSGNAVLPMKVEQALKQLAPLLEKVEMAQSKPACVFVAPIPRRLRLAAQSFSNLAIAQLYLARVREKPDLATSAIRRTLRLSQDFAVESEVAHLNVCGIEGVLYQGIMRLTLDDPKLTRDQCQEILDMLIEHERSRIPYEEIVRLKYIATRQAIDDFEAGRATPQDFATPDYQRQLAYVSLANFGRASLEGVNYDAERAACNRVFATLLQEFQLPYHEASAKERVSQLRDDVGKVVANTKLVSLAMPADTGRNFWSTTYGVGYYTRKSTELKSAGIQLLTAIRHYELSRGRLPESLEEAIGDTALTTVPTDPHSGQSMRYAVHGNQVTVYSVGRDGNDDGGRVSSGSADHKPGDVLFTLVPLPPRSLSPNQTSSPLTSPVESGSDTESLLRVWTSAVGTTLEAEFVRLVQNDTHVLLTKKDGTPVRVPLDKLSEADRDWIDSLSK